MNTVTTNLDGRKTTDVALWKMFLGELEYQMFYFGIRRQMTALSYSINWPECVTYALISVLLYLSDRPGVFKSTPYGTAPHVIFDHLLSAGCGNPPVGLWNNLARV
ncbi:MAG: hypothetical protein WA419_05875 [Silvibacterium sp.]